MIKNYQLMRELEDNLLRREGKPRFEWALRLFTEMWKEAMRFGVLPPTDPLEGIDVDIRVSRILNSCLKKSSQE